MTNVHNNRQSMKSSAVVNMTEKSVVLLIMFSLILKCSGGPNTLVNNIYKHESGVKGILPIGEGEGYSTVLNDMGIPKPKVPKCCPEGQYIGWIKKCEIPNEPIGDFSEILLYTYDRQLTGRKLPDVYDFEYGKFLNKTFKKNSYNYFKVGHKYYLTENATMYEEIPNEFDRWYMLGPSKFCIDYVLRNRYLPKAAVRFYTILEVKNIDDDLTSYDDPYMTAGLFVSSAFMVATLGVYSILPELRNLGGIVLMSYVASMLGAFLSLGSLRVGSFNDQECKNFTYTTYFFFLASFCWMNVMSYDIWWTFRGYAKARPIHRRGERFKYAMYCLYGWGLPSAMTTMFIVLNTMDLRHLPWVITPNVPKRGCFIGESAKRFYLYIPMMILIACNWMFFLMTAFNVWRLSRGTAVLDSAAAGSPQAHRKQWHRFLVYLKISIIMGTNWIMEIVSSFKPHLKMWFVTDAYNILMGLSIFLIFVCKKKILRKLTKKYHGWSSTRQRSSISKSSHTSDSDVASETTPQVCPNPKGYIPVKTA